MLNLSLSEIGHAVKGVVYAKKSLLKTKVWSISTDTRNADAVFGSLFVPIKGENFDGHDFIYDAVNHGAVCVLSEKRVKIDCPYILVDSTLNALHDLAAYHRSLFQVPVVAVTGSVGKTTTKDMIASVLAQKWHVVKTEGNLNNHIGLPKTIFNMDMATEALVVEMGMSSLGEIGALSRIARPDICVITNIGVAHIETLGSREAIFKAKSEIFDYMAKNGRAVLNADDDMLQKLDEEPFTKYYFSLTKHNDKICVPYHIQYNGIDGTKVEAVFRGRKYFLDIPAPGEHMVYNALAAVVTGSLLGLDYKEIEAGISSFTPSKDRLDIIEAAGGFTIINDVYNANPVSMEAAFDVLCSSKGRKVCIIGDMLELGEFSRGMHFETGSCAAAMGVDEIICIGEMARAMYEGAEAKTKAMGLAAAAYHYPDMDSFFCHIKEHIQNQDTVLVKASRGMRFEFIINKLLSLE